jgi:hypothetical protein
MDEVLYKWELVHREVSLIDARVGKSLEELAQQIVAVRICGVAISRK